MTIKSYSFHYILSNSCQLAKIALASNLKPTEHAPFFLNENSSHHIRHWTHFWQDASWITKIISNIDGMQSGNSASKIQRKWQCVYCCRWKYIKSSIEKKFNQQCFSDVLFVSSLLPNELYGIHVKIAKYKKNGKSCKKQAKNWFFFSFSKRIHIHIHRSPSSLPRGTFIGSVSKRMFVPCLRSENEDFSQDFSLSLCIYANIAQKSAYRQYLFEVSP